VAGTSSTITTTTATTTTTTTSSICTTSICTSTTTGSTTTSSTSPPTYVLPGRCHSKYKALAIQLLPWQALGAVARSPLAAAAARRSELCEAQQPAACTSEHSRLAGGRRRLAELPEVTLTMTPTPTPTPPPNPQPQPQPQPHP
jgi:hypothetical protein